MFKNFAELLAEVRRQGTFDVVVAQAEDEAVLEAVKIAQDMGFVRPILVGDGAAIEALCAKVGIVERAIVDVPATGDAALEAVRLVRAGRGQVLMKGFINTSAYMRAILNKEVGLRSGRLISLIAAYELPGYDKLIFGTDSGVNVAPDLEKKKQILANALEAMQALGYEAPKVACLTANELVDPKMPATVDAAGLVAAVEAGELPHCLIEGPISFDAAFDPAAAAHKGITSRISGDVDLLVFPNIETGNILAKTWLHFNRAKWAGIILGATHPVILGSRSDSAEVKVNSIAMSCLLAGKQS